MNLVNRKNHFFYTRIAKLLKKLLNTISPWASKKQKKKKRKDK